MRMLVSPYIFRCSLGLGIIINFGCGRSTDDFDQLSSLALSEVGEVGNSLAPGYDAAKMAQPTNRWVFELTGLDYLGQPHRRHEWELTQSAPLVNPRPQELRNACGARSQIADT